MSIGLVQFSLQREDSISRILIPKKWPRGLVAERVIAGTVDDGCSLRYVYWKRLGGVFEYKFGEKELLPVVWDEAGETRDDALHIPPGQYRFRMTFVIDGSENTEQAAVWDVYSPVFVLTDESVRKPFR